MIQAESLQLFFIEPPAKKGEESNILLKCIVNFYPVFEKNEFIMLQQVNRGQSFSAISDDPDITATHQVVKTHMSFTQAGDIIMPVLSVIVKPIKPKPSSPTVFPPAFSSGGERRNNRY